MVDSPGPVILNAPSEPWCRNHLSEQDLRNHHCQNIRSQKCNYASGIRDLCVVRWWANPPLTKRRFIGRCPGAGEMVIEDFAGPQ